MKALVLKEYMKLSYEEAPMPEFGPTDVLVAVKACGICGSDIHGMDGSSGRRRPPIIMGHEASGVVSEVGNTVNGWKRGDRVTFDSTIFCGMCKFCPARQYQPLRRPAGARSFVRGLPAARRFRRVCHRAPAYPLPLAGRIII